VTASGEGQGPTGARGDAAAVPRPIGVGPEMAALGRFYRMLPPERLYSQVSTTAPQASPRNMPTYWTGLESR
jgi:hypothetical protein